MILFLAILAAFLSSPVQTGASARLMSYDETVRCAGVTQAASELEGGESAEGRALSDAALYWSLTAGQAAVTAGKTAVAADADQARARLQAVREFTARNPGAGDRARADLSRCRQRTPNLG